MPQDTGIMKEPETMAPADPEKWRAAQAAKQTSSLTTGGAGSFVPGGGDMIAGRGKGIVPDDENEKYVPTKGMRVIDEAKKKVRWLLDKHDRSSSATKRAEYMDKIGECQEIIKKELSAIGPANSEMYGLNPFRSNFTTMGGPIRSSS